MDIYLVVLKDEPLELCSAWSTRELAQTEMTRLLETHAATSAQSYYWHLNRLDIVPMKVQA